MSSFTLYIIVATISISTHFTLAQNPSNLPVCDGTQIVYATPPFEDPLTGEIIGAGLDTIQLSADGSPNTFVTNIIGITSDPLEMIPEPPEMELIRSASISPITMDLVLLYQEIDPTDPMMNEPQQRLIIIPGMKLNLLLSQGPGILGYEMQEIDLSETELGEEYPLTEIAFDCTGNLLGVTAAGELVQMVIEPGSSDLKTLYVGLVEFEGIMGLLQGFVGLTYDFQSNTFIAVGGLPALTLVQFQVNECTVTQYGNPVMIMDTYNLCPLGIVDIESRGNNQFYITCAEGASTFGLAILELINGVATILPMNGAIGQTLISLPNSSGGAIIPSIPSLVSTNANAICFPRSIGSLMCNVLPAIEDCEGDINTQVSMLPPVSFGPGLAANGIIAPGLEQGAVSPGISVNAANGQVGTAFTGTALPAPGIAVNPLVDQEEFEEVVEEAFEEALDNLGFGEALEGDLDDLGEEASSIEDVNLELSDQGSSVDVDSGNTSSPSDESSDDGATDSPDDSDSASDDDDDTEDSDSATDTGDDSGDTSDESGDADDASTSGDDGDSQSSDGGSDEDDSMDGDGDESDDDDEGDRDSVDPFEFDFERGSAEDAYLNGNNLNKNGFLAEDGYGSNEGTMISLSPSTLGNLWGLGMIFLGINITFLCICYYQNGPCRKNQDTMNYDNDADIESM